MTTGLAHWAEAVPPGTRVLLIVNSAASQLAEISRAFDAVARASAVSVIAPSDLKPWLIHRGVPTAKILIPRVAGLEIEFRDFLQRPTAIRWAVEQDAAVVLGTEPYPPRNEEVKFDFERAVAPMVGTGRYAVHSLPGPDLFLLSAEDLWTRAARADAVAQHQQRMRHVLDGLHANWIERGQPAAGDDPRKAEQSMQALRPQAAAGSSASVVAARRYAFERLIDVVRGAAAAPGLPRVLVAPAGATPSSGWLPGAIDPVRRPAQLSSRVRFRGTKLAVRGQAESPYGYLVMSRPVVLKPGDAVMAEGRVYRGGITVGLVKGDGWASRVDVDEPGAFLAAAVATEAGPHALVVANCLKGADQRTAVVLRRFGWARAR